MEVSYLVLSYPGDFGRLWPNKRFAVPFESIARKIDPDKDEVEYILNVDEEFLKKAPGFDIDNWPDFADTKFSTVLNDYYRDVSINLVA